MENDKLSILDIYQVRIYNYIRNYHPQIFVNKEELKNEIINRAKAAHKVYISARFRGENDIEAEYEANERLHAFLEFSPCYYIQLFYEELYGEDINDMEALEIYYKTKHIFEKYGDYFENTDVEFEVKNELRPFLIKNNVLI